MIFRQMTEKRIVTSFSLSNFWLETLEREYKALDGGLDILEYVDQSSPIKIYALFMITNFQIIYVGYVVK